MEHNSGGLEHDFPLQMGEFWVPYLFCSVTKNTSYIHRVFPFLLLIGQNIAPFLNGV